MLQILLICLIHLNKMLQQHDLVSDEIPEKFDLIVCRHTMIHLYFADIFRVLRNFQRSGSKYLLLTTHSNTLNKELQKTLTG